MDFADWMYAPRSGRHAVLRGGRVETFDKVATHDYGRTVQIVGDQEDVVRLSNATDLPFLSSTTSHAADSLRSFVKKMGKAPLAQITFVSAGLSNAQFLSEIRYCRRHANLLAGYDTPLGVLETAARAELAAIVHDLTAEAEDLAVFHDPMGQLGFEAHPDMAVFDVPPFTGTTQGPPPEDAPSLNQVLSHADFLTTTDAATLHAMHRPLRRGSTGPLFDFWQAQFDANLAHPDTKSLIEAATTTLQTLRAEL
ncbi:MAG: hypothetical protein AAGJ96_00525 [Pseudomonadota bacterium]